MKLQRSDGARELEVRWCKPCSMRTIHFACFFYDVDEGSLYDPVKVFCCCECNPIRLGAEETA